MFTNYTYCFLTRAVLILLITPVISFPGWFWGDPHFKTLDDKNYTFNGIGEYTMLDAESGSFILQARTVLAPGNRSIATVFSAGAAEELETSKVEVRAKNGGNNKSSYFLKIIIIFVEHFKLWIMSLDCNNNLAVENALK